MAKSDNDGQFPDPIVYPFERQLAYVSGWVVLGGLAGFVAWSVAQARSDEKLDVGKWVTVGGGLAGAAALTWVASLTLLP